MGDCYECANCRQPSGHTGHYDFATDRFRCEPRSEGPVSNPLGEVVMARKVQDFDLDINSWCDRIVNGGAGLISYHEHECLGDPPTSMDAVKWALRCLANPKCEGSDQVLRAIMVYREKKAT